jgi:hypothetical protein
MRMILRLQKRRLITADSIIHNKNYILNFIKINFIKKKAILLRVAFFFITPLSVFAQPAYDTVYIDYDWSVCEKPVASYYRVALLNKNESLFYYGDVKDYYLNGSIEMTGRYDDKGNKQGTFTFYNPDGTKIKEGNYEDDKMKGLWSYYDSSGILRVQLNCNSANDFIPLLVIDSKGDTLLKNGNGTYSFDFSVLQRIQTKSYNYSIEGELKNGVKTGKQLYHLKVDTSFAKGIPEEKKLMTEIYKDGKFIRGIHDKEVSSQPFNIINLADTKLQRVDNFNHSNIVFEYGKKNDYKLIDFLVKGASPEITVSATSQEKNIWALYKILGEVIQEEKGLAHNRNSTNSYIAENNVVELATFYAPATATEQPNDYNAELTVAIDTNGYISDTKFRGNLKKSYINKINYYLSRLSGLYVEQTQGRKEPAFIDLSLFTIINKIKGGTKLVYQYYCTDLADTEHAIDVLLRSSYFKKNLDIPKLAIEKAPKKKYVVTVSFLISEDGSTTDIKTNTDPGFGLAEEAIRIVREMPKHVAKTYQKAPDVRQERSITFYLEEQE